MRKNSPKKVFIVDCDFLYKTSDIPNFRAMKLYSYHTQLGDRPMLITEEYHLTGTHDILYLIRELRHTPIPPGDILDDKRTVLMGKEFKIFDDHQELPLEAAVCRPDYTIYTYEKDTLYSLASYAQFFNGNVWLKDTQEWRRDNPKSTIVIVDDNLWDAPPQILVEIFTSLKEDPRIIFMHPIKLKKLANPEVLKAFGVLKLAKIGRMRYNNNIGEDYNSVCKAIDVIGELRIRFPYLNIGSLPVKIITKDHWKDKANIFYDFERCLKIMVYAQTHRVRINFKYPTLRLASPSWHYFDFFKVWSNHHSSLPYIPARLIRSTRFYGLTLDLLLREERKWNTQKINETVYLLAAFPDLMYDYGFINPDGTFDPIRDKIDYNYIREKAIENSIL